MTYTIKQADGRREMNDFVRLPRRIYEGCPQYVPDLERDVRRMFSPRHNPGLATSEVQPFVAYDQSGQCVGRIVAILNHKANAIWGTRCVRFGMVEFVNDREVSRLLLQTVERWGRERGMTQMQGPLGITDFDKEGMLIDDFDQVGSMVSIYNPPYYPHHIELYGMTKQVDWLQVRIDIPDEVPARYRRVARLASEMYGLRVTTLTRHDLFQGGQAQRVFDLLNRAYRPLFGFSELSPEQCRMFINQYFPLADLRLIPVVLDAEGRIVGVAITIGSLTRALRRADGRLWPTGWFHLARALKFRHEEKVELLLTAVEPEMQGLGVNALFFDYLIPVYRRLGYRWAETGPMLEDNLRVLTQWRPLRPTLYKRRRCYCKDIEV